MSYSFFKLTCCSWCLGRSFSLAVLNGSAEGFNDLAKFMERDTTTSDDRGRLHQQHGSTGKKQETRHQKAISRNILRALSQNYCPWRNWKSQRVFNLDPLVPPVSLRNAARVVTGRWRRDAAMGLQSGCSEASGGGWGSKDPAEVSPVLFLQKSKRLWKPNGFDIQWHLPLGAFSMVFWWHCFSTRGLRPRKLLRVGVRTSSGAGINSQ